MLEFASRHVTATNIRWQLYAGTRFPLDDASAGAVFTYHVFQHLLSVEAISASLERRY